MLKLSDIKKDYQTSDEVVHALNGVTVEFRQREFVSILGPSGCGKTTLMNVIGGLDGYTDGELFIDGKSTKDFKAKDWDNYRNKRIGFVFQSYNLIPHLSVLKNVEMALTLSGVSPEARKAAAMNALDKVGLTGQAKKRPNQLSGGQMQRVAIARAIVNAPDVLLADEPTGALDTATGEQIMDVLKELSKDRLVIIVTHNPELAEKYSTRIIRILDGRITSDTDPFDGQAEVVEESAGETLSAAEPEKSELKGRKDRTAMSFLTALSLSFGNLVTKKGRTILTSIAGSIGIIGISLILAVSNGMNLYINKLTTDTLSTNPITVQETAIDVDQAMDNYFGAEGEGEKYPALKEIVVQKVAEQNALIVKNTITEEYVDYVKNNLKEEWINDVQYTTGMEMYIYTENSEGKKRALEQSNRFYMMVDKDFVATQYDVLDGKLPENKNELLLVVDEYNRLSDLVLRALGILDGDATADKIKFSDVKGKEYYFLTPDGAYFDNGRYYERCDGETADYEKGIKATIVGIARLMKNTEMGSLKNGIGYTKELYNELMADYSGNQLLRYMEEYPTKSPTTGENYTYGSAMEILMGQGDPESMRAKDLRKYGGIVTPNDVTIYPKDFSSKNKIKAVLDGYNKDRSEEEKVAYTDMSELVSRVMGDVVDIVSYVLIGFTAISLLVGGVMIGIITYISVIERTREIGILRALGARKKDVTRVFNAETFIIGLIAGVLGVSVTGLLTIPINLVVAHFFDVYGIANLSVWHGFLMIGVSVFLTVLSGLIPSVKASRRDPVTALRTE